MEVMCEASHSPPVLLIQRDGHPLLYKRCVGQGYAIVLHTHRLRRSSEAQNVKTRVVDLDVVYVGDLMIHCTRNFSSPFSMVRSNLSRICCRSYSSRTSRVLSLRPMPVVLAHGWGKNGEMQDPKCSSLLCWMHEGRAGCGAFDDNLRFHLSIHPCSIPSENRS